MKWKIWKKKPTAEPSSLAKPEKLAGPKEIPSVLGRYLVVSLGKDPDWVWNLKVLTRPRAEGKPSFDVRVFDKAKADSKGVSVKDYRSLDPHPDLVLYEGWYNKKTNKFELKESEVTTHRAA